MNRPIIRLYALGLLLLTLLVAWTSRWTVFESDALGERAENRRPLIAEQQIRRGDISTRDGVVIAESTARGGGQGEDPVFVRSYPQGALFGNPVGYNFIDVGRSGIEQSENDLLVGEENEFQSIIDQLRGVTQEGADVTLTIDAEAQRLATEALQGAVTDPEDPGAAAVAIEPDTGAVRAMASVPGFDPNVVQDEGEFERLSEEEALGSPLLNRPTQSTYPPGSTMKVVTAAAALDSGEIEPTTVLNADSPKEISGVPLQNSGGQSFGDIDATSALTDSVNTYWAQVGEQLGTGTMVEYMERFGFYSDPELDYPGRQMQPSGAYSGGELVRGRFDVGRVAIGQGGEEGQVLTTALQMAQVAGVVANGGVLMEPTFVQQATGPDGRTIAELDPSEQGRAISEETAATLTEMMTNVTNTGTAAGLSVPGAAEFAGKTGTAEIDLEGTNQPWFIAFAPTDEPQIAVAVTIERCQGCSGGEVAGPIATELMGALLQ